MKVITDELAQYASAEKAVILQRFFKTGKGEYGEGDVFIGVAVPDIRRVARNHRDLTATNLQKLISSKIHEQRMLALVILIEQYKRSSNKKNQYNFYVKNMRYINNWDLVDVTAHHVVGDYLFTRPRDILYKWVESKNLWQRRIAILASFYFIRHNDFSDILKLAKILLPDQHDLMHKAVGWMLREVGKRDLEIEEKFLLKHYKKMPRTMLRYAIEKFPETKRKAYLAGEL